MDKKILFTLSLFCGIILHLSGASIEVINAGVGGDSTRQGVARFDRDVMSRNPDCVILLFGTNDRLNSYNMVPLDQFKKNLLSMIEQLQNKNIKVILCEVPNCLEKYMVKRHKPGFFDQLSAANRVKEVNRAIQEVAKLKNIPLIPTAALLGPATEADESLIRNMANAGTEDGVHPTPDGYRKLAEAIKGEIDKLDPPPARIVCFGDSITNGVHVKGAGTAAPDAETYPGQLARLLNSPAPAAKTVK